MEGDFRAYTISDEPVARAVGRFVERTGRPAAVVVVHPNEVAVVRGALSGGVRVETVRYGGPHEGEVWVA